MQRKVSTLRYERYEAVQTSEDEDDRPEATTPYTPLYSNLKQLRRRRLDALPIGGGGPCTKLCFMLSTTGTIFLTIVGYILAKDTFTIEVDEEWSRPELSGSVFAAAAMYFVMMCITGFMLLRGPRTSQLYDDDGRTL